MPQISVVMAVYNEQPRELQAALDSIRQQTFADFELIVILDNPTNTTLKQLLVTTQQAEPRLRLLINPHNLGLAPSLQRGCAQAQGTWIARMDADDIALPDRLATQLQAIQAQDLDVLSGNAALIDETDQVIGQHAPIPATAAQQAQLLPLASTLIHPAVLMKRASYLAVGGYQNIPTSEDYELWLRFLSHGYRLGALNQNVLHYRIRPNSMTQGDFYKIFLTSQFLRQRYRRDPRQFQQPFDRAALDAYYQAHHLDDQQLKDRFRQRTQRLSQTLQRLPRANPVHLSQVAWYYLTDSEIRQYAQHSLRVKKMVKSFGPLT
ncbi:glycosyltransferase [Lapidilactobacillus achengensis]|uniref:Glycosyltransferase n=1 Tax=Lapidilactobacillus achengensis TaxID=2486000 RepID=A0ABW1UL12_9LACO|nr:glycosyltransferase [Lapidilactobacillus achengensis]